MPSRVAVAGLVVTFGALILAGVASDHGPAQTFVVIWSAICAKALIVLGLLDGNAAAPEVRVVRSRAER